MPIRLFVASVRKVDMEVVESKALVRRGDFQVTRKQMVCDASASFTVLHSDDTL